MKSKVIKVRWFTTMNNHLIGIIIVENEIEQRAYIGVGNGDDERADVEYIKEYGTPYPLESAKQIP